MVLKEDLWRYFASDYVIARQRFLDASAMAEAILTTLTISEKGPSEENLSIDVAYLGPKEPEKLIIHTSGVHGVEGFPGSAVQVRLLERFTEGKITIPNNCGIIIAHAINPHGFAWLRRVNENNADLNRNFLPPNEAYIGEPEKYHELDKLLNPRNTKSMFDFFSLKAAWVILRMGFNVAKQTIAEGQYERPKALQYGGSELCEGPKLWLEYLSQYLPYTKQAIWIDFHTGLGPFGIDSLLISGDDSPEKMATLTAHYGPTVQPNDPDAGVAYKIRGGMMDGVISRWPSISWTAITQEFGTFKPIKVLRALRAENRMTQWSLIEERKKVNAKERRELLEIFNPNSEKWQAMIMERGQQLIDDVITDLE
tara:strand:- start:3579 stop:4682 length:1104 start_codon:yes stop_codon:yes gene_type:complete